MSGLRTVRVETPSGETWDRVLFFIQDVVTGSPPLRFTRRLLKALRERDFSATQAPLNGLHVHVHLLLMKQDPRVKGYPIRRFMKFLHSAAMVHGFPSWGDFAILHSLIGPRVAGTAYGVGWPASAELWEDAPEADPVVEVYRRIRRVTHDEKESEGRPPGAPAG